MQHKVTEIALCIKRPGAKAGTEKARGYQSVAHDSA